MADKKTVKAKEVEVKIMGAKMRPEAMDYMPMGPKHKPLITIEEIKNGYVIKSCCENDEGAEFVKNLSSAPSILAKLFDVGNKSATQISEMVSSKVKG